MISSEMFERLVISKHCKSPEWIAAERRLKLNSWRGGRIKSGMKKSTVQQKVEYLEENPTCLGIFAEVVDGGGEEDSMEDGF